MLKYGAAPTNMVLDARVRHRYLYIRPYGMASTATEIEGPLTPLKPSCADNARWVPLAFAAIYILWESTYIGIRIAIESFPPLAMAAIRWVACSLPDFANQNRDQAYGELGDCGGDGCVVAVHQQRRAWLGGTEGAVGDCGAPCSDDLVVAGRFGLAQATRAADIYRAGAGIPGGWRCLLVRPSWEVRGESIWQGRGAADWVFCLACASLYSKQRTMPESPLLVVAMHNLAGGTVLWIAAIFLGEVRALHSAAILGRSWMALYLPDRVWVGDGVHGLLLHS